LKTEILSLPRYKNAYNCKRCPQTNDESGCPKWLEITEHQDPLVAEGDGFVIRKGCVDQMLPGILIAIAKGVHTGACETSALREATARSVGTAAAAYLYAKGLTEVPLDVDTLEGPAESRDRLVHETASEFIRDSGMLDSGVDSGKYHD
jgi:hypothetical protein